MQRSSGKRRRRRPEEAEGEILDAAERFLRKRPFRDLQVANLMDATGLRRSSFYHYFRDRHDVIVRLVEKLADELQPMNERWFRDDDDPITSLREGYRGVGEIWAKHGPLLRAIAEAAIHDRKVEKAQRELVDTIVRGTAKRIRTDVERGRTLPLDADDTAHALILMSMQFLNDRLGRGGRRDWKPVVETLSKIWLRTLYGEPE